MQTIYLHPQNPQPRLLSQIANALENGQIIAYPTATGYALISHINAKNATDGISRITQCVAKSHQTLLCTNISDAANYAQIDNEQFRYIKNHTPSSTTFILNATKQTPKHLLNKDKHIGIQITDHTLIIALVETTNLPIVVHELNSELIAIDNPYDIEDMLTNQIDLLVHVDTIDVQPLATTDLTN